MYMGGIQPEIPVGNPTCLLHKKGMKSFCFWPMTGDGESRMQPANPGLPEKWSLK